MDEWIGRSDRLPSLTVTVGDSGKLDVSNTHKEPGTIGTLKLMRALGLNSSVQFSMFVSQALSMGNQSRSVESQAKELNEIVSTVAAQKPRDVTEAMLCLQMAGVHIATTNAIATFRNAEYADLRTDAGNIASKLSRTFTMQMDALKRHRTKGKSQKVVVEHKHYNVAPGAVSPGANAVFGDLTTGGGVGAYEKTEGQSHERSEPVRLSERPPVLSLIEADRLPVQSSGDDGQARVPVPRREGRGAQRAA